MSNNPGSGKVCVVLLSGGLDSATVLYFAKKKGFSPVCLIFDYGQRHKREISSAARIARAAGCPYKIIKISLPWQGSALLDERLPIPVAGKGNKLKSSGAQKLGSSVAGKFSNSGAQQLRSSVAQQLRSSAAQELSSSVGIPSTYVPARNTIFLSFALSFAEAINAEAIFIGANAIDYSGYPDCRPEFYRAFEKVIAAGTKAGVEKRKIKILTPLIGLTKAGIIRLGIGLGVPYELTWSCYRGKARPCGKCESCFYRALGFKQAKLQDPALRVR